MGFSLNQVNLIGKLGGDAEHRFTTNNVSVTTFSMVTEHSYKKDDEWIKTPCWHKIVMFNVADWFKDQLKKGTTVHVGGRIQQRDYTDKEGVKRYITEIIGDNQILILLPNAARNGGSQSQETTQSQGSDNNGSDDDLPF